MSITQDDTFRPRPHEDALVETEVDDGLIIYDNRTHKIHQLNRAALTIWRECDGIKTIVDIEKTYSTTLGIEIPDGIVKESIQHLIEVGLLEPSEAVPEFSSTTTRRRLMKRAGIASAVALPLILSVSAPTAAQQQSGTCHDFNESCTSDSECCAPMTCQGQGEKFCST